MKNIYKLEYYDTKDNCSKGFEDIGYTNKKTAIKIAKQLLSIMCDSDKNRTEIIVNKYNAESENWESIISIYAIKK